MKDLVIPATFKTEDYVAKSICGCGLKPAKTILWKSLLVSNWKEMYFTAKFLSKNWNTKLILNREFKFQILSYLVYFLENIINFFLNILKLKTQVAQVDSLLFIVSDLDNRIGCVLSVPNNTHISIMPSHCVKNTEIWITKIPTLTLTPLGKYFKLASVIKKPYRYNSNIVFQVGSQHDMIVNVWDWKNNIKARHL